MNTQQYESKLEVTSQNIESKWSKADGELCGWIAAQDVDTVASLLAVLKDRWFNDVWVDKYFREVAPRYPEGLTKIDIDFAARVVVHELREYSAHTFGPSIKYEETLEKVHVRLGRHFKSQVPKAAAVAAREDAIAKMLTLDAVNHLTAEDLAEVMAGLNFDPSLTAEQRKAIVIQTIAAGGIALLSSVLSKVVIKKLITSIIERYFLKVLGKKGTEEAMKQFGKRVAAKSIQRFIPWIGWALLLKDVIDIGGEATRITTPLVSAIAIGRSVDRASE